jgi:hypothetical protein
VRHPLRLLATAALLALLAPSVASADVAPSPSRPTWDDHPVPMPSPPDDDAAKLAVAGVLAAGALAAGVLVSRRRVVERPS